MLLQAVVHQGCRNNYYFAGVISNNLPNRDDVCSAYDVVKYIYNARKKGKDIKCLASIWNKY